MRCVDTDFLIDVLTANPRTAGMMGELDELKEYHTTVVNEFELLAGAIQLGAGRENAARMLLSRFHILDMDRKAAQEAAAIYADCRRKGKEIPMRDAMIAGIAKIHGCSLVTGNAKHFGRVSGLKVVGL
jgi:tRNA(fMet)-specific endonuclease VapC